MRKKKSLLLALSLVLVIVTGIGSSIAAWSSQTKSKNLISMGSVRGKIVEEYQQESVVYPGGSVSKTVNVSNTGSVDMLARVKVDTFWNHDAGEVEPIGNEDIQIDFNSSNWYFDQQSGYYYYKNVLSPGETTEQPLFSSFAVSKNLNQAYAGANGTIQVKMECVQAGGNGVQFWNKTLDELGIKYTETTRTPVQVGVQFKGEQAGFVFDENKDDLFANFKNLVPGETCNQSIRIENSSGANQVIFLHAKVAEQEADQQVIALVQEMLQKYAIVRVTNQDGQLIYDGPADGNLAVDKSAPDSMSKPISLGAFAKDKPQSLSVELSLNPEMDNQYQSLLGKVTWVFSASGADEGDVVPPIEQPTTGPSSPEPSPGMGDDSNLQLWLAGLGVSTVLLLACCVNMSIKKKNTENN